MYNTYLTTLGLGCCFSSSYFTKNDPLSLFPCTFCNLPRRFTVHVLSLSGGYITSLVHSIQTTHIVPSPLQLDMLLLFQDVPKSCFPTVPEKITKSNNAIEGDNSEVLKFMNRIYPDLKLRIWRKIDEKASTKTTSDININYMQKCTVQGINKMLIQRKEPRQVTCKKR